MDTQIFPTKTLIRDVEASIKRGFITRQALAVNLHAASSKEAYQCVVEAVKVLLDEHRITQVNVNGYMCFFPA